MKRWQAILATMVWAVVTGCDGCGASLTIQPIDDQAVRVGETLNVDIAVDNPDGVSLSFSFDMPGVPDSGAEIYSLGSTGGRLRWTPTAAHVGSWECTVHVSGGGGSDSETFLIRVAQQNTAPVFIQPGAGGTYDLTRDPCVAVHIEVKDDDSTDADIVIAERNPRIDGGELTASGRQADWSWCPNPAQVDASDRYTLALTARDEDPEHVVTHDYVIVLRGAGGRLCPGEPPQITTTTPPPPAELATDLDYRVEATVTDDLGLKEAPLLYWTTEAPADPENPDVTAFRTAVFVDEGGGRFSATIPNLRLADGERRTIWYVVSATDNDDTAGAACDHRTDSELRSFDVLPGVGTERAAYCEPCSASSQCASDACVAGVTRFCSGDCASCPAGAECRSAPTVEGPLAETCVPVGLDCGGSGVCTDDRFEENDARADAASIIPDLYTDLQICPGDPDYYSLYLSAAGTLDVGIDGWDAAAADIDLQLLRSDGTLLRTSAGLGSSERATVCVTEGAYRIRVYGIGSDSGPYNMNVASMTGFCCIDDDNEDNDVYGEATPILGEGEVVSAQICAGDDDWFVFDGSVGRRASVDMLIEGDADLDMELYDRDGLRRLAWSAGITDSEHMEADLPADGDYYIRAYGYRGAEGAYLLSYELLTATACTSSATCPTGTVCNGTICVDDACSPGSTTCPGATFCPAAGGVGTGASDCVEPCTTSSDCRTGYACKIFEEGRGCAIAGTGQTGDPCSSFRSCAGDRICLGWPGGYCARGSCTTTADCATDAVCVQAGGLLGSCLEDCWRSDDMCRLAEGHTCECAVDRDGEWQFVCLAPAISAPACF